MRKPGNILLLAVVIGALSAAMVYRHLRALRAEIELAQQATKATHATVDVVVAADTIPVGTRIEAAQVKVVPWPGNLAPEGAIADPKTVLDGVARVTIEKNQPLNASQLLSQGVGLLPPMITEGKRAMSVRVDEVTGVSGFITPNSRVDVLIAGAAGDGGSSQEQRSKLILQNVRVLATGKSIEQHDDRPVEVPTVTLLVSPQEAEKLTLAARYEPVRLALRNYQDEDVVGTPGVSSVALFEGNSRPNVTPAVARSDRHARYSVEVLLGEKLTRQELF